MYTISSERNAERVMMERLRTTVPTMDTLYHYCSTDAFHSIISTGSIRLSSMLASNDFMEGKLVRESVMRLAATAGIDPAKSEAIVDAVQALEESIDGLGFCLSENGDLLSQWRGYADDAGGLAIGFNRKYFELIEISRDNGLDSGLKLRRVLYSKSAHDNALSSIFEKLLNLIDLGALSQSGNTNRLLSELAETSAKERNESEPLQVKNLRLKQTLYFLTTRRFVPNLFALKSSAFEEEREWRLMREVNSAVESDSIQHRAGRNQLIRFALHELFNGQTGTPIITEVVLGPKHRSHESVIGEFLENSGFRDVKVRRSSASYR